MIPSQQRKRSPPFKRSARRLSSWLPRPATLRTRLSAVVKSPPAPSMSTTRGRELRDNRSFSNRVSHSRRRWGPQVAAPSESPDRWGSERSTEFDVDSPPLWEVIPRAPGRHKPCLNSLCGWPRMPAGLHATARQSVSRPKVKRSVSRWVEGTQNPRTLPVIRPSSHPQHRSGTRPLGLPYIPPPTTRCCL